MDRKKKDSIRIAPLPSRRWRHHVDIVGRARSWLSMLSTQDDATIDRFMADSSSDEDIYVVELSRRNGTISQKSHALHMAQALLRFGDERLCQGWLIPSLQTGHEKSLLLAEALKLQRYDWFERIRQSIQANDHQQLGQGSYEHGPLFQWACSPPPPGQEPAYEAALDNLLRLPPYENRRKQVIDGLEKAFETALSEQNLSALDVLEARGLVMKPEHVEKAVQDAAPNTLSWLLERGGAVVLQETWGQSKDRARILAEALTEAASCEVEGSVEFARVVDLMRVLAAQPHLGTLVLSALPTADEQTAWGAECQAAALASNAPARLSPGRAPRL